MDPEADTTAPRGRRGRGRGFRGRGRGRPRGQGRGRGAAILNGEDGPHYSEYESTARIEEIVDTDEVAPAEDVEVEGTPEETAEPESGRGGRGRGRGRGRRGSWRRRRGRGRGGAPAEDGHVDADANTGEQATAGSESRPARQRRGRPPKQHLTHFLSLPIGHHAQLQKSVSAFTDALLAADPAIDGLDPTIVVPPRRLHLTLGVMSLAEPHGGSDAVSPSEAAEPTSAEEKPTLERAIAHLESLKPLIKDLLAGEKLRIELSVVDIMHGGADRASVMWVGPPKEGELVARLQAVADFVNDAFKSAGFLVDEGRPLKLHCTVLNTMHRKPRPKWRERTFFSYTSVLTSDALRAIALDPDTLTPPPAGPSTNNEPEGTEAGAAARGDKGKAREHGPKRRDPVRVDLGTWDIDEVQICEMGSHGPEGEYVCVGKIALD